MNAIRASTVLAMMALVTAAWAGPAGEPATRGSASRPSPAPATARAGPPTTAPAGTEKIQGELAAAVERLVAGLRSNDYDTRVACHDALVSLHRQYLEIVLSHSDDRDAEVRQRLAQVMRDILMEVYLQEKCANLTAEQRARLDGFKQAFPQVCRKVLSPDLRERIEGLRQITETDDPEGLAEPVLLMFLGDGSDELVAAAAHAACSGQYASDAVVDVLLKVLLDERTENDSFKHSDLGDISAFREAAMAVKQIRSPRAVPTLVAMLVNDHYSDTDSGSEIADAIAALGEKRAIPHLLELLSRTENAGDNEMWSSRGQIALTTAPSDLALMALVRLTGQNYHRYGITFSYWYDLTGEYGFTTPEKRSAAIAKFQKWWEANKNKPEYRDLKRLDLPTVPARRGEQDQPGPFPPGLNRLIRRHMIP